MNGKAVGSRSSSASFEDQVQILDYVDEPKDSDSDRELEAGKVSSGRLVRRSKEEAIESKINDLLRKASPENSSVRTPPVFASHSFVAMYLLIISQ